MATNDSKQGVDDLSEARAYETLEREFGEASIYVQTRLPCMLCWQLCNATYQGHVKAFQIGGSR